MSKKISDIVNGILEYLESEKMISELPKVIDQLKARASKDNKVAIVESTKILDDTNKIKIKKLLKDNLKWNGQIKFEVNSKLLGGIKIILGDRVLDLSLKNRLEKIYEQI